MHSDKKVTQKIISSIKETLSTLTEVFQALPENIKNHKILKSTFSIIALSCKMYNNEDRPENYKLNAALKKTTALLKTMKTNVEKNTKKNSKALKL